MHVITYSSISASMYHKECAQLYINVHTKFFILFYNHNVLNMYRKIRNVMDRKRNEAEG